jgi:hypothetical protein
MAVREVARFNKIPEASPALVGIGTLATAIGKRALVIEREGLRHHPALFLVGIAGSGCLQAHAGDRDTPPILDRQRPPPAQIRRGDTQDHALERQVDPLLPPASGQLPLALPSGLG